MLSPGPSLRRIAKSRGKKKRYHRPQDIREGMTNAIMLVKEVFFSNLCFAILRYYYDV